MSSVAPPAVHQREGRGPQEGQKNEMYGEMTLSALSTHRKGTLTCSPLKLHGFLCSKTQGEIVDEIFVLVCLGRSFGPSKLFSHTVNR